MLGYSVNLMPDTRLRDLKNVKWHHFLGYTIIVYCANCGREGPRVPADSLQCNFACYLCNDCAEKWGGALAGYVEPDAVFWERVKLEQMEKLGREMTAPEIVEALKDENHFLSKLVKDRPGRG